MKVTKAPNLNFKHVIHLALPQDETKIYDNFLEALKLAEKNLRCGSLATPALGTGKT